MRKSGETYLGDSVYASVDGDLIWLRLGLNRIALEPAVYAALVQYHDGIFARVAKGAKTGDAE